MKRPSAFFLLGLAILLFSTRPTSAQWERAGKSLGGWITALAAKGTYLFAATRQGGVWISQNRGVSWTAVNSGLPVDISVTCLAASGQRLFAGTDRGIFVSVDHNIGWTTIPELADYLVYCIAGSGRNLIIGTWANVLVSRNGGQSWKLARIPPPIGADQRCTVWALDDVVSNVALRGSIFFARTTYYNLISINNGATWTLKRSSFPEKTWLLCLVMNSGNVFAGTTEGVYLSKDYGTSWKTVNSGLPGATKVMALELRGTVLFAGTQNGVFMLLENEDSWTQINNGFSIKIQVSCLLAAGQNLYAGTREGEIWRLPLSAMADMKQKGRGN